MKRTRTLAAIAVLGFAAWASAASAELLGAEAPDFVLKSLSGENLRLSEYRGEVVMLSFWASWCGDCRNQLEELSGVHERYRDAGVEVLAVSLDGDAGRARDVAEGLDVSYPLLFDAQGEIGRLYEVDSMPFAVLIDRDGVVRHVFEGHRRGAVEPLVEQVRALLRE